MVVTWCWGWEQEALLLGYPWDKGVGQRLGMLKVHLEKKTLQMDVEPLSLASQTQIAKIKYLC